jgi:hypothetical protein
MKRRIVGRKSNLQKVETYLYRKVQGSLKMYYVHQEGSSAVRYAHSLLHYQTIKSLMLQGQKTGNSEGRKKIE